MNTLFIEGAFKNMSCVSPITYLLPTLYTFTLQHKHDSHLP